MRYFVTGIDTDSGKTLTSAILCEALMADYWKPIQSGLPRDADTVASLITNTSTRIFPEAYLLRTPASPHAAAKIDGVSIELAKLTPPASPRLIVEGAGGCLAPLNDHDFVIDIAAKLELPLILVSDLYLGSINHTLLTVNLIRQRNLPMAGIVFNGEPNPESERIIEHHAKCSVLLRIQRETEVSPAIVRKYAAQLKQNLQ